MIKRLIVFFCMSSFIISYNHPEIDWMTFETDHFIFHHHKTTSRSANEAALVAESVYKTITELYNYYPRSKTTIIIKDTDDISNGAAYYFDNKIVISSVPLDFDLRGSHRWLQNVITHEFTHIIQIGASMKFSKRFPMFFVQGIGYVDESRPDVLYGYPNSIISYPLPNVSIPPWFAEGTAQNMGPFKYDYWDTHRDMIVRDKVYYDNLLSLNQMNTFGKSGAGQEFVYCQGFSFTEFIYNNYGDSTLSMITDQFSKKSIFSLNKAFKNVIGKDAKKVYNDWKEHLISKYEDQTTKIKKYGFEGDIIVEDGITNLHPVFSPLGDKFAFLSNMDNDFFGQTDLYIYSFSDSSFKKISSGVKMAPCWYGDSLIVYTKRSKPTNTGSRFFDLYKYNLQTEEEDRITNGERVFSPSIDDTGRVFAIRYYDGTANIVTGSIINNDLPFDQITNFDDGTQIFSTSIYKDSLFFDLTTNHHRDIASISLSDTNGLDYLPYKIESNIWDSRSPRKNTNKTVFSDDRMGIYNIFLNTDTESGFVTNVMGGAFTPSINSEGKILYSTYKDGGYKIAVINNPKIIDKDRIGYKDQYYDRLPISNMIVSTNKENRSSIYKEKFGKLSIMPRLMFDYGTFKPGFYFLNNDPLDKFNFLGQFSINKDKDLDIALLIELKRYYLTYFASFYWVTRHVDKQYNYINSNGIEMDNMPITNDLTFLIFSSDIGTKFNFGPMKINLKYSFTSYRQHILYNMNQNYTYNGEDLSNNINGDFAFDYYRSKQISIGFSYKKYKPSYLWNMVPTNGYGGHSVISYEDNDFLNGFGVDEEYGTFGANLEPNNTFRIDANLFYNFSLLGLAFNSTFKYNSISNKNIDDFFNVFGGGATGLKGYTYYEEELSGTDFLLLENYVRAFVFKEKSFQVFNTQVQALSLGLCHQFGTDYDRLKVGEFMSSVGVEYRILAYSFFSYPTAVQYEYFIPYLEDQPLKNGKHYFNILFDF